MLHLSEVETGVYDRGCSLHGRQEEEGQTERGRDQNDLGTRYSLQELCLFSTYTSFPGFHTLSMQHSQLLAIHLTEEPMGTFQFLTTALSSEAVYRKSK